MAGIKHIGQERLLIGFCSHLLLHEPVRLFDHVYHQFTPGLPLPLESGSGNQEGMYFTEFQVDVSYDVSY